MKLIFLIISVCSIAEEFRSSSSKPSRQRQDAPRRAKTRRQSGRTHRPGHIDKTHRPPGSTRRKPRTTQPPVTTPVKTGGDVLTGLGTAVDVVGIGVDVASMSEANRLQNKELKAQAREQQKYYEFEKDMTEQEEAAKAIGAPKVCLDCLEDFKKMRNAIDEELTTWCSQFIGVRGWYDPVKQTCTAEKLHIFFNEKALEIFKRFGGENNKCLKAKSEYLNQLTNNSECKEADDPIIRCLFDQYHDQFNEGANSCVDIDSCPLSHKYAYLDGKYCCRTNKEKNRSGRDGHLCDGSVIGIDSRCCENNDYAKCGYQTCSNHKDAGASRIQIVLNSGTFFDKWFSGTYSLDSMHNGRGVFKRDEKDETGYQNYLWHHDKFWRLGDESSMRYKTERCCFKKESDVVDVTKLSETWNGVEIKRIN